MLILISQTGEFYIGEIQIMDVKWTNHQVIRSALKLQRGQKLNPFEFKQALVRVWDLGLFDDIKVLGSTRKDTLDLLLVFKEAPRIKKFEVKGAKQVKGKTLIDTLNKVFKNKPATERNLFAMRKLIEDIYKKKGFLNAKVEYEVGEPDKMGEAIIKFSIDEGEKFKVGFIDFKGNLAYSSNTLKKILHTKEYRWYLRFTDWYIFKEDRWQEDLRRVENFYQNHGYPDAKVDSFSVFPLEKGFMGIVIYVSEGERYKFGDVEFSGNQIFDNKTLQERFKSIVFRRPNPFEWVKYALWYRAPKALERGLYSKEKFENARAEILGLYADSGYIFANAKFDESREKNRVNYRFEITENWRVKVRLIEFLNNTRTYDYVLRREFLIFPGDYFSRALLIRSLRNLYYLGYFENVSPDIRLIPNDSQRVDLVITVKERPTGQISAGASYSQLEGLFGNFSLQQPNLFGRGQYGEIRVDYGKYRKNLLLSFREPWFLSSPTSLGASAYYLTQYYFDYWQNKVGFSVDVGRRIFGTYWGFNVGYRFERLRVFNISDKYKGLPFYDYWKNNRALNTSTVSGTVYYDSRDRIFNPISGLRASYELNIVGGPFGGDVNFLRHFPDFQYNRPLPFFGGNKLINHFRLRGGLLNGLSSDKEIPFFEYFILGDVGFYGLRGYDLRSVGTKVGYNVIGGKVFGVITYELRLRLDENFYILGFLEGGNAWWELRTVNLREIKRSAGIGIRANIPMLGIMGIDLGYGFDEPSKGFRPHFQIGTGF